MLKAEEKAIALRVVAEAGSDLPRLGDSHRVQQILHNLLSNAIKFTESGRVTLAVSGVAGQPLRIRVTDTGIGMTEAQQARLFEDFRQADNSITRRFGGTGLGMSIVRQLVDMMQGTIMVRSAPEQGSAITVTLPLAMAATGSESRAERDSAALAGMSFPGLRLLAADDNRANREILSVMMKSLGVQARIVNDGAAAVAAARDGAHDILLLDISMPVMDGVTALARIRAEDHDAGRAPVPALAVTANAMAHQVAEYLDAGFDAHVSKPFGVKDLRRALSQFVPGDAPPPDVTVPGAGAPRPGPGPCS